MRTSENISEIAAALSKAQAELHDADKDGKSNFGKHATISSVMKVIRPVFGKHGLAISQVPWTNKDNAGAFTLSTMLVHSSGQWISGDLELLLDKSNMQGIGSAITYARRYMAAAIAGVGQEDDDGAEASKEDPKAKQPPKNDAPQSQAAAKKPAPFQMTEGQRKNLFAKMNDAKWTKDQLKEFIKNQFGTESTKTLTYDQYQSLKKHLETKPSPVAEARA